MTKVLNKNSVEYSKRQDNRYRSAYGKIEHIMDFTKMYNQIENSLKVKRILNKINSLTTKRIIVKDGGPSEYKCIEISESPNVFTQEIYDELFPILEDIVCKEISEFESNIKQYLEYAPDDNKKRLSTNIRELTGFAEMSKNDDMLKDLFNIKNDLLSCLSYHGKIESENKYE